MVVASAAVGVDAMSMGDHVTNDISRRTALRRIGAGAAVAWSAPVLVTMHSAGAGSAQPCDCHTNYYRDLGCDFNAIQGCAGVDPNVCFCGRLLGGNCSCIQRIDCTNQVVGSPGCDVVSCAAQGFPGFLCVETCCDVAGGRNFPVFQCLPPCGA
jgi:hypothetical protein